VTPATSHHGEVINIAMCDGSVQSVTSGIDQDVWIEMGTRNGSPLVAQ
jgi:prepilin-type processing-associated H-X9-DG protein